VGELAWSARRAELSTIAAATVHPHGPALERAARELLALQASDWAFQVTYELAGDYPLERVRAHSAGVDDALAALTDSRAVPEAGMRNLAPQLDVTPLHGF
jgi:1,4-alpha-glucan branching enzyme